MMVVISVLCQSDSANSKLLHLVMGGTGKEIFLPVFLPPDTLTWVFLGAEVEEMKSGLSGKVSS